MNRYFVYFALSSWIALGCGEPTVVKNGSSTADNPGPPLSALSQQETKDILDRYYDLLSSAKTLHLQEESLYHADFVVEYWLIADGPYRSVMTYLDEKGVERADRTYGTTSTILHVDDSKHEYTVDDRNPGAPFLNGMEPFLQSERPEYTLRGKVSRTTFQGKETFTIQTGEQSVSGSMVSVFVDTKTLHPIGWEYRVGDSAEQTAITIFELDIPITPKDCEWNPPKGYGGKDGPLTAHRKKMEEMEKEIAKLQKDLDQK